MINKEKGPSAATAHSSPEETPDFSHLLSEPMLDRGLQSRIGDKLRALYDELSEQPVPDRFKDLLDRLEQRNSENEQPQKQKDQKGSSIARVKAAARRVSRVKAAARRVWGEQDAMAFLTTSHPMLGVPPLEAARTRQGARKVEEILRAIEFSLPV